MYWFLVHKIYYSGTPPYDHPVYKTTSLLRPYSFKPKVQNIDSFYYFEDPVNATTSLLRPGFYGPTVVVLTGFHCTHENNISYIFEAHAGLFVIFATLYLIVFIRLTCWKLEGFANSSSICPFQDLFLKERLDIPTDEIFERVISKNQK